MASKGETSDFVATNEWQEIQEGQKCPGGLHYRMNLETGRREAKLLERKENAESDSEKNPVQIGDPETDCRAIIPASAAVPNLLLDSEKVENQQPRAPKDMQGLLKFCLEATKGEDALDDPNDTLEAMDPTRREWLEHSLSSMSVDVIKELTESMKILNSAKNPNATEEDIEKIEYAFECIGDWVDQIDMANNFHKIGGFECLKTCLKSNHASIRSASANAIAELSQNNLYCQENFVKDNFLPLLLDLITNDHQCQVKAMYAISCIIRECPLAQEKFLNDYNGPSVIMNATMTSGGDQEINEKLRIKGSFFISSLCQENEIAKEAFIEMGLGRQILTLMQIDEHSQSHEHMARALLVFLKDNDKVKNELVTSSELKLKEFLQSRMKMIQGHEEFEEEFECLKEIGKQCYGTDNLNVKAKNSSVDR